MAAPKTAYKNTSLFRGNIEHLIAILQISEATHKSRFYLDGYISVMTPDGKGGVVGYVALGSANANMHNLVRRGGGLRSLQGGQVVQLLNDGGLNTYGVTSDMEFTNIEVGKVAFRAKFTSSYYSDSIDAGFNYRINNQTGSKLSKGYISKNSSQTISHTTNPLSLIQVGDTVTISAFIENSEGIKVSTEITRNVTAKQISAMFTTGWPSQANNPVTIYTKQSHTYTVLYSDAQTLNPAPDGYYVFDGDWYEQSGGVIVSSGKAQSGSWPAGDPGNPSVQSEDWYGFSTISRQDALNNIQPVPLGTMYRNPSNMLWYLNYNQSTNQFTDLVPTGFYAIGNTGGLTYGIQNGQLMPPNWNG